MSPRLELSPLTLTLARALRVSQAPAAVRPGSGSGIGIGIGTEDLLSRVQALDDADFPLLYAPDRRRSVPQQRDGTGSRPVLSYSVLTSTGSLYAAAQGSIAAGGSSL
ncbi:hypothetical protein [Streptomyces sp. AC512_CC834]|uniref:hypothetical protein n=1 Tax=Streptomyces sp. AC512_CC834 TaxID=2823691 RepID=UPI001C279BA2|nr:hypothetical protein [Streptomyces sp. AC512_CC834]